MFSDYESDGKYFKTTEDIMDIQLQNSSNLSGATVTSIGKIRKSTDGKT